MLEGVSVLCETTAVPQDSAFFFFLRLTQSIASPCFPLRVCTSMLNTSQPRPLVLIGSVDSGVVDSYKIQLQPLGGATGMWIFTQVICILFY